MSHLSLRFPGLDAPDAQGPNYFALAILSGNLQIRSKSTVNNNPQAICPFAFRGWMPRMLRDQITLLLQRNLAFFDVLQGSFSGNESF
jgi:hypothetical protein